MRISATCLVMFGLTSCGPASGDLEGQTSEFQSIFSVTASVRTPILHQYDDAPRTPDADDPALWISPDDSGEGLIIVTLKDAGLQVYDLAGQIVQTLSTANRPPILAEDPPVPGVQPDPGTEACPESESGERFGRYNNVDIQYELELPDGREIDVAVVTDRGCDRLRIFEIDPSREGGPLFDITDPGVERIFPTQFVQPSPLQPADLEPGVHDNPLDDEVTAYGLALFQNDDEDEIHAFANQAGRSVIAELELFATEAGTVSYRKLRELRFNANFSLPTDDGSIEWTPCREDPNEDPQFEGMVIDHEREILYAGQEVVGIWKVRLRDSLPAIVNVPQRALIEPVKTFGLPYFAIPEDDEFSCELEAPSDPLPEGTIAAPGDPTVAGDRIEPDLEGLTIYYSEDGDGYLLASSQGDDTFHVFRREGSNRYLGLFEVEGAGETDGMDVTNARVGSSFANGMLVVQSGEAEPPVNTDPINGFEYDASTEFHFVRWEDIANGFASELDIEPNEFDPRDID